MKELVRVTEFNPQTSRVCKGPDYYLLIEGEQVDIQPTGALDLFLDDQKTIWRDQGRWGILRREVSTEEAAKILKVSGYAFCYESPASEFVREVLGPPTRTGANVEVDLMSLQRREKPWSQWDPVVKAAQFSFSPEGHRKGSGAMGELKAAVKAYNEAKASE